MSVPARVIVDDRYRGSFGRGESDVGLIEKPTPDAGANVGRKNPTPEQNQRKKPTIPEVIPQ